jgi:hypothetical protein
LATGRSSNRSPARQRLAAEAGGAAIEPVLPVLPAGAVVEPSPALLQADKASAAVSAQAREVSRMQFI